MTDHDIDLASRAVLVTALLIEAFAVWWHAIDTLRWALRS